MTFQPGHKLSPGRQLGSRNKRNEEIFLRLEQRGDKDPADLLSEIVTNEQESKELRVQAANFLMPYKYGKHGSLPPARYVDLQLHVPEFTPTPVSARFTVAISSASPAILSSLGWSTGILRADRASARTECPASSAALTVSRPIPLLAPMIRTVATASCSRSDPPGSPSCARQAAAPQDGRAA